MSIIKPPSRPESVSLPNVFLAGSIEMGAAIDWQTDCSERLSNEGYTVFNPRRDDWDSSWEQSIDNDQFREQVEWELDMLRRADWILLYLAAGTKSPISLLELGLYAGSMKIIVVCDAKFWRRGNVDIVCRRYNVMQQNSLADAVDHLLALRAK